MFKAYLVVYKDGKFVFKAFLVNWKTHILIFRRTYELGEQEHFNTKLGNSKEMFTYLVPTDKAWADIKHKYASAYKVNKQDVL